MMDDQLTAQLTNNPTFLIQGFSGMQPLIQQAMQDQDLSYDNFGSKSKNNRDQSKGYGKSKGKSKSKGCDNSWRHKPEWTTLTKPTEAPIVTTMLSPTTLMPKPKTMATPREGKGTKSKALRWNLLQHRDQLKPKAKESPKTKGKTPLRPSETELAASFFPL